MNLKAFTNLVTDKSNFLTLENYINFSKAFIKYIEESNHTTIVSRNEPHYKFFQFNQEGNYQVTRPFNSNILCKAEMMESDCSQFISILNQLKNFQKFTGLENPQLINNVLYTIQQSIGFALDSLSVEKIQAARKLNGDLFERLILIVLNTIGVNCTSGIVKVPVLDDQGKEICHMQYQHDLIIKQVREEPNKNIILIPEEDEVSLEHEDIKVIGSVKVTSKDRIDKIFIDKHLFSLLSGTKIPHIAIFLHDVQRKEKKSAPQQYGINTTFLAGRFKGYTVKLNPLDGAYYFDPRPNMMSDSFLKRHIKTFDQLISHDIWKFVN